MILIIRWFLRNTATATKMKKKRVGNILMESFLAKLEMGNLKSPVIRYLIWDFGLVSSFLWMGLKCSGSIILKFHVARLRSSVLALTNVKMSDRDSEFHCVACFANCSRYKSTIFNFHPRTIKRTQREQNHIVNIRRWATDVLKHLKKPSVIIISWKPNQYFRCYIANKGMIDWIIQFIRFDYYVCHVFVQWTHLWVILVWWQLLPSFSIFFSIQAEKNLWFWFENVLLLIFNLYAS